MKERQNEVKKILDSIIEGFSFFALNLGVAERIKCKDEKSLFIFQSSKFQDLSFSDKREFNILAFYVHGLLNINKKNLTTPEHKEIYKWVDNHYNMIKESSLCALKGGN